MLVWVLIVGCWVGLLLLILHDTTKNDSNGSAIRTALRVVVGYLKKIEKCFQPSEINGQHAFTGTAKNDWGGNISWETCDYDSR
jgi:hypothetical protein